MRKRAGDCSRSRPRGRRFFLAVTIVAIVTATAPATAQDGLPTAHAQSTDPAEGGAQAGGPDGAEVVVGDDVSPFVGDASEAPTVVGTEAVEVPEAELDDVGPGVRVPLPADPDPVVQVAPAANGFDIPDALSAPRQNFAGMTTSARPPDTVGDVGPNHYIQMVNSTFVQIFDKTGSSLLGPFSLGALWPAGNACSNDLGDPIVVYDQIADRWLLTQFARSSQSGPYFMCFAVSQTADPTAAYWLYTFQVPAFPDYPKFGVWRDGYYMTTAESFDLGIFVFDRVDMLTGSSANYLRTTISALTPQAGVRNTRILPAEVDGPVPAVGTGVPFVRTVDKIQDVNNPTERIEVYEAAANFGTDTLAFPLVDTISPAPFSVMRCNRSGTGNVRDCIPQPDSDDTLDALSNRLMMNLKYRTFPGGARMVVNQTVDVSASLTGLPFTPTKEVAGIRWYELRDGANWTIANQGTFAAQPGGIIKESQLIHRWMGSTSIDQGGNIALGYSAVNSDSSNGNEIYPSLWYTGRLATDPAGIMTQPEQVILAGTVPQGDNAPPVDPQRWGDYAAMTVDPTDECTFWFTGHNAGNPNRPTRIASFDFSGCGGPPGNDAFSSADTIGGPADTKTGSNVGYSVEAGEPDPTCGDVSSTETAWWNWTAPATGNVTIDTFGSNFDTVLTAYTGAAVNALTEVACNDDAAATLQSEVTFAATAGTTYRVQVDGWSGATGNITLNTSNGTTLLCNGLAVTVDIGAGQSPTVGDDVIRGTNGPDNIDGLGGDDTICGLNGDDVLAGGTGHDTILGEGGNDTLKGQQGNDTLFGGSGNDLIAGNDGDDAGFGGAGIDDLKGGSGVDTLDGGADDDEVRGGSGSDTLTGGTGNDVLNGGQDFDTVSGGIGNDIVNGAGSSDPSLNGDDGDDLVRGGNGGDTLNGGPGDDQLLGVLGADTLNGGPGDDDVRGGDGNDDVNGDEGDDDLRGGYGTDECDGGVGFDQDLGGCETVTNIP